MCACRWLVAVILFNLQCLLFGSARHSTSCQAAGFANPCQNGAACRVYSSATRGVPSIVTCDCKPAWTGGTCEIELDPCADGTGSCGGGWNCIRNASNVLAGYDCGCGDRTGYRRLSERTPQCVDIDECALLVPACHHGGTCYNRAGTFTCSCRPGYAGPRCQVRLRPTRSPDGWRQWSAWSACSATCGDGEQRRSRICRRRFSGCEGEPEQGRPCVSYTRCSLGSRDMAWEVDGADDETGYSRTKADAGEKSAEKTETDNDIETSTQHVSAVDDLQRDGWIREERRTSDLARYWKLLHFLGFEPVSRRRRSLAQIESYDDFEMRLQDLDVNEAAELDHQERELNRQLQPQRRTRREAGIDHGGRTHPARESSSGLGNDTNIDSSGAKKTVSDFTRKELGKTPAVIADELVSSSPREQSALGSSVVELYLVNSRDETEPGPGTKLKRSTRKTRSPTLAQQETEVDALRNHLTYSRSVNALTPEDLSPVYAEGKMERQSSVVFMEPEVNSGLENDAGSALTSYSPLSMPIDAGEASLDVSAGDMNGNTRTDDKLNLQGEETTIEDTEPYDDISVELNGSSGGGGLASVQRVGSTVPPLRASATIHQPTLSPAIAFRSLSAALRAQVSAAVRRARGALSQLRRLKAARAAERAGALAEAAAAEQRRRRAEQAAARQTALRRTAEKRLAELRQRVVVASEKASVLQRRAEAAQRRQSVAEARLRAQRERRQQVEQAEAAAATQWEEERRRLQARLAEALRQTPLARARLETARRQAEQAKKQARQAEAKRDASRERLRQLKAEGEEKMSELLRQGTAQVQSALAEAQTEERRAHEASRARADAARMAAGVLGPVSPPGSRPLPEAPSQSVEKKTVETFRTDLTAPS